MIGAVVLAAGEGRRFRAAGGGLKLLAPWRGRPLVEAPLAAVAAAAPDDAVVVLGAHAAEVARGAALGGFRVVRNAHWRDGMASSLQVGLAALAPTCRAAVVVLGDGPTLSEEAVRRVIGAARAERAPTLLAARYADGSLRHPVAIARSRWAELPRTGEAGARLLGEPTPVDCTDLAPPGDADTPEALGLGSSA